MMNTLIVVGGAPEASETLQERYRVVTASSADKMFGLLDKVSADLIVLDLPNAGEDGFEALARLKSGPHASVPVVFLLDAPDPKREEKGFDLGAADFVVKPFSAPLLLSRVESHLNAGKSARKLKRLRDQENNITAVLADMIESRDKVMGKRIEQMTQYVRILLGGMRERGLYAGEIRDWDTEDVVSAALLYDVGKITVSDLLLNKPGKLTDEEFGTIQTHAVAGEWIIDQMIARTGGEAFLRHAKLFAGYHHERWDGLGYPRGLKGESIPLQGRIMAIPDVYNALVSVRPYKKALPHEEADRLIMESAGKRFDPLLADVFYETREQFRAVM